MKNYSAKKMAVIISAAFSLCAIISHFVEHYLPQGWPKIIFIALFSVVMFVVSVILLNYVFGIYIIKRLQPIYSTTDGVEEDKEELKLSLAVNDDNFNKAVTQVNNEMARLLKEKSKEISQLKANEKYRKDYLGDVAHELRTPLFIISGYIESLTDGAWEDKDICLKYLDRTSNTIERMISIVNDLGTIAKFDSNAILINMEAMDLIPLVQEVLTINTVRAREKHIDLVFNKPNVEQAMVLADKVKIYEVDLFY